MDKVKWLALVDDFAALGYELRNETTQENPYTVVVPGPKRFVLWRTRTGHTLYGILRTLQHSKGLL